MNAVVRIAEERDAPALVALLQASEEGGHLPLDPGDVQVVLRSERTETVFVAELSGKLAGYAAIQMTESFAYTRPTAELTDLFVLPAFRRTGIGTELLKAAIKLSQEHQALELFARVNVANTGAVKLYESQGLRRANHFEYRIKYY